MNLEGTTALVTGGARRVGRAIVLALARAGCDVAIHHQRSETQARELAVLVQSMGRRSVTPQGDLNDADTWEPIVKETVKGLGRLDVLVNNASTFLTQTPDTIEAFDSDLWDRVLRVNLTAAVGLSHYARPHLDARGQGKIVNLCDIAHERPWRDHLAYCASKAGLVAMTKALAAALAPSVQVNAVAPGIVAFPPQYGEELRQTLIDRVPLRRPGTPEEVAKLERFIIESGDYMTGEVVHLDGGRSAV